MTRITPCKCNHVGCALEATASIGRKTYCTEHFVPLATVEIGKLHEAIVRVTKAATTSATADLVGAL